MAARTSVGVPMGIFATVACLLAAGFFVTSVVFYSQRAAAEKKYAALESEAKDYITEAERQRDDIRNLANIAKGQRQSVVGYLNESFKSAMQRTTGSPRDSFADFKNKLDAIPGAAGANLLQLLQTTRNNAADLKKRNEELTAAAAAARSERDAETARVQDIEKDYDEKVAALQADVDSYAQEANRYRDEIQGLRSDMDARVERIRQEAADREAGLGTEISDLSKQLILAQDALRRAQEELRGKRFKPADEFALVDGGVVGVEPVSGNVFINRGSKDKLRLGMTFTVYESPSAIRQDPNTGEYQGGKATIEVVSVDNETARCRVLSERRGNPVLKGDVIVNAVYDPNKVYTFLIYGNFDANGDGQATEQEQSQIAAMIEGWGGKTTNELSGDVDFVVLGQRPVLPIEPGRDAPVAIIEQYLAQRQRVERYDNLFRQATATSIPVLNENRLYTLTGRTSAQR